MPASWPTTTGCARQATGTRPSRGRRLRCQRSNLRPRRLGSRRRSARRSSRRRRDAHFPSRPPRGTPERARRRLRSTDASTGPNATATRRLVGACAARARSARRVVVASAGSTVPERESGGGAPPVLPQALNGRSPRAAARRAVDDPRGQCDVTPRVAGGAGHAVSRARDGCAARRAFFFFGSDLTAARRTSRQWVSRILRQSRLDSGFATDPIARRCGSNAPSAGAARARQASRRAAARRTGGRAGRRRYSAGPTLTCPTSTTPRARARARDEGDEGRIHGGSHAGVLRPPCGLERGDDAPRAVYEAVGLCYGRASRRARRRRRSGTFLRRRRGGQPSRSPGTRAR